MITLYTTTLEYTDALPWVRFDYLSNGSAINTTFALLRSHIKELVLFWTTSSMYKVFQIPGFSGGTQVVAYDIGEKRIELLNESSGPAKWP